MCAASPSRLLPPICLHLRRAYSWSIMLPFSRRLILPAFPNSYDTRAIACDILLRDHALPDGDETRPFSITSHRRLWASQSSVIFTCPLPPTPPAVPRICRQETVAATALFEVTHAIHARNAVSRRSSANRSTKCWRAHIRVAMNGQSGSCVSALLFLTRFPTAPPLANISAAVKSNLGLPRHANISRLSTVVHVSVNF